jgi:hypothetical protein
MAVLLFFLIWRQPSRESDWWGGLLLHGTLHRSGNAVIVIMGSSGLEELNHLPTVQSWPPFIISCFETQGTLAWRAVSKQQ